MRYEYIEPLVATTKKVLSNVLRTDVSSGAIGLVKADDVQGDVSIVIKVKGDSEGCIMVNMETVTAQRVCAVMNGSDGAQAAPLEMDAIAELSNMLAGNATSALNDLGYDFMVYPPVVVAPADIPTRTEGVELFRITLATPCGEMSMHVALRTE